MMKSKLIQLIHCTWIDPYLAMKLPVDLEDNAED